MTARPVAPEDEVEALAVDLGQTHDHEIGLHDSFERVFAAQAAALFARGWRSQRDTEPLREALKRLWRNGYQPMYNGRPSCPFCFNFVDDEETHKPSCLLRAAFGEEPNGQ